VPIDRRRELDEARLALTRLRRSAEMGRASRAELRTLRAKLRSLFSAELLERLEGWSTNASVIEIAARERDLPWELLFSDETHARPTRRQRGVVAPRRALRRILLLADPGYDGALDELDLVEGARAWEAASRATTSGEACDALRDSWDVVHYAGHQGPADDGTPGLQLADGRLPIAALIDEGFVDPPSLLFLHACSTFSSTRVTDSEQGAYVDYGAFELLESSRIPCVIGTLWDVNPPPDRALVRAFYEGLDTHGGASVALASARASTASSGRWVTLSSAYVAYGDVRTREYHDG
jgi:hypothetical protein